MSALTELRSAIAGSRTAIRNSEKATSPGMARKTLLAVHAGLLACSREVAAGLDAGTIDAKAGADAIAAAQEASTEMIAAIAAAKRAFDRDLAALDGAPKDASQAAGERDRDEIDHINRHGRGGPDFGGVSSAITPVTGNRSFRGLFPSTAASLDGFRTADEYLQVIGSGRHDPRLRASTHFDGDDARGGFAVPTELARVLLDRAIEDSIVLRRATVWPMASKRLVIPRFVTDGGANGDGPYGVPAEWLPESGTESLTPKQFELATQTLTAHSIALYCEVANALAQDGLGFTAQLQIAMRRSLSWHLDRACLVTGQGAGEPQAILRSPARIAVTKLSGQKAATITYENATAMLSRLAPASFNRAVWLAHVTALPELMQMSLPVGTGGSAVAAVTESGGQFRLLGKELIFSEQVPALGSEGDLSLIDFSAYHVGLRADLALDTSGHVGFREAKTAFRLICRVDGQTAWQKPYTMPSGTTVSPYVVLGARA